MARSPQSRSKALRAWNTEARAELDDIEAAHVLVGGKRSGRRHATLQLNRAYAGLLSSQFQRFCRDLHTEAAAFVARNGASEGFRLAALNALMQGRKLDSGNPNEGNLGADFGRLGMTGWLALMFSEWLASNLGDRFPVP